MPKIKLHLVLIRVKIKTNIVDVDAHPISVFKVNVKCISMDSKVVSWFQNHTIYSCPVGKQ